MFLPDWSIRSVVNVHKMIEPFVSHKVIVKKEGKPTITYGLEPHGYVFRISPLEWTLVFARNTSMGDQPIVNMYRFEKEDEAPTFVEMPPRSYLVGRSVEYFKLPDYIMSIVVGRNTYAERGILFAGTILEAGWEGYITFTLFNLAPSPTEVYFNDGIGKVLFVPCDGSEEAYKRLAQVGGIKIPPVVLGLSEGG